MHRALDSAIGLPSRSMSALWMLVFLMPVEVRRYFMIPLPAACPERLLPEWRLPEFDLVSLGIDDPTELARFRGLCLVDDVATFRAQRREHCVQIRHAEVDDEGRRT